MICRSLAMIALLLLLARATAPAQSTQTLHLLASPVDDATPVLYAQRAGLFAQAGLNVVVDRANNGGAVAAAVVGGAADIGKGDIGTIVSAHTHNVPLVIVAPSAVYDPRTPDCVLLVPTGSPIHTARDLDGKTIGVATLNSVGTTAIQAWMDANGGDANSVKFVELRYSEMMLALKSNRVAATEPVKPFITDAVDSGDARILYPVFNAISNRFLESAWYADRNFVAAHHDAIVTFQRVVAQASAYTNAHQSETVDLMASWTGIPPDRAAHMPRIVTGTTLELGEIQPVVNAFAKYKLIAKPFDAQEIIAR